MNKTKIYLAGGISGLPMEETFEWRKNAKKFIEGYAAEYFCCFSPTDHYMEFLGGDEKKERAAMNYDLYNLRKSDVVLVNMNHPQSLGTMAEIGIAHELRIPIVAFRDKDSPDKIHPWQKFMIDEWFPSLGTAIDFIVDNYHPEF